MLTQGEPLIKFDDGSGELPLGGLVCGLLLLLGGLLLLGSPAAPAPRPPLGARAEQALAEPQLGAWAVTFRSWHSPFCGGGGVLELD